MMSTESRCRRHVHSVGSDGRCPICIGRASLPPWITEADAPARPQRQANALPVSAVAEQTFDVSRGSVARQARCRWASTDLDERSRAVGRLWAELVGVTVKRRDALAVA